jgi:DNA transposition AAA+ family ATPase
MSPAAPRKATAANGYPNPNPDTTTSNPTKIDASRRHIRKIQWRKEMHTELTKSRSTKKLRDLAEEALELFYE